jgi:6,7-dimethyl-8-ribityllumazine synthase
MEPADNREFIFRGKRSTHGLWGGRTAYSSVQCAWSFELVFGAKKALEQQVDAVIVIGSVIQGETKHFDFVCQGVTQGIVSLNLSSNRPVVFCVLTDNKLQQAIDRSGGQHGNKGVEAAVTALKMIALAQQ